MRVLPLMGCLGVLACGPTLATTARGAAVRLHAPGVPPAWRYTVVGPVAGESCGALLVPPLEEAARADLRERATAAGAHAVIGVACRNGGMTAGCWTSLRCDGTAVRWLAGQ
jgi:hypothetical protein